MPRESHTQRARRIRLMAAIDWDAISSEVDPVRHASRTFAAMTPERRAELERDYL